MLLSQRFLRQQSKFDGARHLFKSFAGRELEKTANFCFHSFVLETVMHFRLKRHGRTL